MSWYGNNEKSLNLKFKSHNTYIPFKSCNYRVRYCESIVAAIVTLGVSHIINGIRADHRSFTGMYWSVKKDTVTFGSGAWVRTHDAWVLLDGHGMVCMLLTRHTIRVYQYWMYERGQEEMFLAWD
jgi:hypothetical protein